LSSSITHNQAATTNQNDTQEECLIAMAEKAGDLAASEACDVVPADVTRFLGSNQPQDDQRSWHSTG
jgi:hypothetical protein